MFVTVLSSNIFGFGIQTDNAADVMRTVKKPKEHLCHWTEKKSFSTDQEDRGTHRILVKATASDLVHCDEKQGGFRKGFLWSKK